LYAPATILKHLFWIGWSCATIPCALLFGSLEGLCQIAAPYARAGLRADLALKNYFGIPVLHSAACNGHKAVVQLLLENGADIEAKNESGGTALHWAADGDHVRRQGYGVGARRMSVSTKKIETVDVSMV
jgi:hypothetical protein